MTLHLYTCARQFLLSLVLQKAQECGYIVYTPYRAWAIEASLIPRAGGGAEGLGMRLQQDLPGSVNGTSLIGQAQPIVAEATNPKQTAAPQNGSPNLIS